VTAKGLEKQQMILDLESNPEYAKVQETPAPLLTLFKKISNHRSSGVFRKPVRPEEAPGYAERILFPVDLALVRKMITSRIIVSYADMHKRIGLICHNCLKFNGRCVSNERYEQYERYELDWIGCLNTYDFLLTPHFLSTRFNRESDYGIVTRDFEAIADAYFIATMASKAASHQSNNGESNSAASVEM